MRGRGFRLWSIIGALIAVLVLVVALPSVALAGIPSDGGKSDKVKKDMLSDPLTTKQLALKEAALENKAKGKAYGKVAEVARGQYVQLVREGEGVIWTVLGEFPDCPPQQHSAARSRSQQHQHLGAGLQPCLLHGHLVQGHSGRELDAQLLHRTVVEPVHGAR